ncbi:DUF6161 domain-containing protein [Pseudomonas protegens]|uniref:DUF6161 domain-containing protein n=1 Tax=Pseudomonas protegens TaxID=380021 RepID=UPI000FF04E57|nr:DUF6161 domain-containing protein [Pseudomonas protegens]ROL88010.1 hypothetical protein BK639_21385 [Pseudomonas protegens]ROL94705.1 hypothetical protein BK640_30705 [Pseudomonas protegens]ROM04028.1 hypothetical protein BK642_20150 [Pseudomonas protegens]ROM05798.1 hypothetical protein BK641_13500 [Pseudomonas protegens]
MQTESLELTHKDRFDRIKSLSDDVFDSWLTSEKEYWKSVLITLNRPGSLRDEASVTMIDSYIKTLEKPEEKLTLTESIKQNQTKNPLPFHDDHAYSDGLKELLNLGHFRVALYIFRSSLGESSRQYTNSHRAELDEIKHSFNHSTLRIKEELNNELNAVTEKLKLFIEASQIQSEEKLSTSLEDAKTSIRNTVDTANAAIMSVEPVKYWEEREKKHKEKAHNYLTAVKISAFSFIALVIFLTLSVYKNSETYTFAGFPISIPVEKFGIALLIITTTASIWFVRVLVKLMMTNLALEIEALERSTMIKTYIAMDNAKVEQSSEIRMLFYSTLFKPSTNNLADDSTSPEYIRIIEAMMQKKGSN